MFSKAIKGRGRRNNNKANKMKTRLLSVGYMNDSQKEVSVFIMGKD